MIESVKRAILLHRPGSWSSSISSSTKIIAGALASEGHEVSYLGEIVDSINLIKSPINAPKSLMREKGVVDGVHLISSFTPLPIRDIYPLSSLNWMRWSYRWCIPSIRHNIKKAGLRSPDIVWAARPGASVLKDIFPDAKLVMQVVDYYPAYRGDYIKTLEKNDYERADHIFLVGAALEHYLVKELGATSEKITNLGQGVSLENYTHGLPRPRELNHIEGKKAIWVGVLAKADEALFRTAAIGLKRRGASMILIGPPCEWAQKMSTEFNNVHLLGPKPSSEIPAYLMHSDIGLMLYDQSKRTVYKGQNPLKLYEYAAAKLDIISTPHEEYDYLQPPIRICKTTEEVESAIGDALQSVSNQNLIYEFAQAHDWRNVYTKVSNVITNL